MLNNRRDTFQMNAFGFVILFILIFVMSIHIVIAQEDSEVRKELVDGDISSLRVIVYLHEERSDIKLKPLENLSLSEFDLKVNLDDTNWFAGELSKEGLEKLKNDPRILRISKDQTGGESLQQSLPLINATVLWGTSYNLTGLGQTICIIDTGINYTHSNLGGCDQTDNISDGSCAKVIGGWDFVNNDADPMDDRGHGTHVAGIAAANGSINGTAPYARIVAVKVVNSSGTWIDSNLAQGVDWCDDNRDLYNISVITISLGSEPPNLYNDIADCETFGTVDTEIMEAKNNGIFVDVSSGNNFNNTHISYPGCVTGAVSVGSSTKSDAISSFSNRGILLDLLAPGELITSTASSGPAICSGEISTICSGTSQAAPHVAGAAALLLEKDSTLTPDELEQVLVDTGKSISGLRRIDLKAAVDSLCICTDWSAGSCGSAGGVCKISQRIYTRTCENSCDTEISCTAENSCLPGGGGGQEITVCQSGCNHTTILEAIETSRINDKILITDNATYNENVTINSSTSPWIHCQGVGSNISGTTGSGIYAFEVDGPVVIGCRLNGFIRGIHFVNSSHGVIQGNTIGNSIAIQLEDESNDNKVLNNNLTGGDEAGIRLEADSWSSGKVSENNLENNLLVDGVTKGIWIEYGVDNRIVNNTILGSTTSPGYGIHLNGHGNTGSHDVEMNTLKENTKGIFFQLSHANKIDSNTFCPSNSDVDIDVGSSTETTGDFNTCEKPGSWNDPNATSGCFLTCDTLPSVSLLDPLDDATDSDGNVDFICYTSDNSQLVNVTLYHNISGIWSANQTANISGTTNTTTFTLNGLSDNSSFIWNCLAYDNASRSSFFGFNFTLNIQLLPPDPDKFFIGGGAWLGNDGNIALLGNCTSGGNCTAPADSFIIQNSSGDTKMYIDSSGNLCTESAISCADSDEQVSCSSPNDSFIVLNNSVEMIVIDSTTGDLCSVGKIFENAAL